MSTAMPDMAASPRSAATRTTLRAVRGAARWLGLAAAPTFAVMALITYVSGSSQPDMLCSAAHGGSVLSGMAPMYLLMSVFRSAPWLKLIWSRGHQPSPDLFHET
jgi:hypothetical protein